ncbi:hypothetical protein ONS95_002193 [Cadophora gregata]|uniref:uncharacterized protein n=1 Tax=Cadophora gregata TaxID=51156 RepID=UPI0026DA71BC|nr:uncharacterized protein ONS95_002193 [Cadophora gregata]KAK0109504.1 hypothetical protein ONS95_002193 [Cadophora gregata]KAK0110868.1 hypothetical protein ONS96_002456 [Cadophora gregata f. sp. sojae]
MQFPVASLPPSTSPDLHLTHPTPAECQHIWTLIHPAWGDSLDLPQFLAESEHLLTVPLARDGGMTLWILVDKTLPPDERPILASCETFKKKGLLSREGAVTDGVQDVVIHGIASVFCDPAYRGRGYAQRMMQELGDVLKTWQVAEGETCVGSVLYSDIGKEYYSKLGWEPVGQNCHLEFPAKKQDGAKSEKECVILDAGLGDLCKRDEELTRQRLKESGTSSLMVVPDQDHMRWHHGKEDFVCGRVLDKECPFKGVLVGKWEGDERVWAIWTRRFYGNQETARRENTLYILRLVFEKEGAAQQNFTELRESLKVIIEAAQAEAEYWGLGTVKLWDPSPLVIHLMQGIDVEYKLVEREEDGIASLMWYGDGDVPHWVANQKYAWL